jgi:cysteine synthase A
MTSVERVTLLKQLAAKVVAPGAIILDQFKNPANPEIHRKTTAIEIWEDTQSGVDYLISAVGTGGTITGVRRRGSQAAQVQCPCHCRGARQRRYPFRRYGGQSSDPRHRYRIHCGHHEPPIIDAVIAVSDEDAFSCARRLAREEGIVAGASSGAALQAALAVAGRKEAAGKIIVVILADTGERYVTTKLFSA